MEEEELLLVVVKVEILITVLLEMAGRGSGLLQA